MAHEKIQKKGWIEAIHYVHATFEFEQKLVVRETGT
jgi:hypothetical protein